MTPISVSTTELPDAVTKLEIEVSPDMVEHSIKHAVEHMAEELKLPGFREGKVPPELARQKLGEDAVFEHAFNDAVSSWYAEAIAETDISPIGSPSLKDAPDYTAGESLKFELEVPVRPPAELGDYQGIEVGRGEAVQDDSIVDRELEVMRDRFSTLAEVDRPAKLGDFADINFTGLLEGTPFEGGSGRDFVLELGSNQFIPGFEEQVVGAKAGDELDVNVSFPDEYQAEHLAGKAVVFKVEVNSVKEKKLAELTDEFASENLGYDTMQELRDEIKTRAAEAAEKEAENRYRWAVVDAVAKQAKIDVPKGHIHHRAHELWQELAMSLSRRGVDPRMFLQAQGKSEHEFIEGAEEDAELTIRRECVIAALIEQLEAKATEEEMIAAIAEDMGDDEGQAAKTQFEAFKETGGLKQLENEVLARKAIDHLVEAAKPIPLAKAEARDAMWTPEKGEAEQAEQQGGGEGLWTPGP
ncbi:MAG: trigger factor [Actinobacteria bacterium]|nr:trigger factor [Actinomycetota bacterium]